MEKSRKYLLSLLSVAFLCSCVSNGEQSSDPLSLSMTSGSNVDISISTALSTSEEDIFDMGYTSLRIDGYNYYRLCDGLYVNKLPGVYDFGFNLRFAYNSDKADLYYNYDGEKPMLNTICHLSAFEEIEIYENVPTSYDEIPLTTSVDEILRNRDNRCVSDNYINNVQNPGIYQFFHNAVVISISFVYKHQQTDLSLTYLVDQTQEYKIPMLFLSMPYVRWFGSPYYFYNNIYEEVDTRVHLEYYDPLSKEYWQRNSKIKLGGGWSKGYPQRTLNVNFNKDEHDEKNEKVTTAIFGDRKQCGNTSADLTKFIRFRIHNGGNCFEQWSGFNDAILQKAMFGTHIGTTAYRPCLVYLNGEYWGLMQMREHYSDYYIQQNYGVDKDNVTMFEVKGDLIFDDGDESGLQHINALKNLLNDSRFNSSNQTTFNAAYNELAAMVDMDSLIDVMLAEFYCCNWDFVGNSNNLKMWRAMKTSSKAYEDGKWRFGLHDADFAFSESNNYLSKYQSYSYNNWRLMQVCMKSNAFRSAMVSRAEELAENNLSRRNLTNIASAMYEEVKPYKKDSGKRWGQPNSYYTDWINYYSYLANYFSTRSSGFVNELKNTINSQYGGYTA